jgi:putative selenium metabolism hydrolase
MDFDITKAAIAINAWMEAHREELVRFVRDLVRIDSRTYQEGPAVAWLAERMRDFGYAEVRIDPAGNCLGRVGSGPTVILADAHIDTVDPGDPADWGFDPLEGRIEGGRIEGRGVIDDKGCLSAMVFAGRALAELGYGESCTFWVSGSISEEDVEGSCVRAMMEHNGDIKPNFILVGEASEMTIVRGHKGRALIKMSVKGKAAHASAAWKGENALIKALPLIDGIDKKNDFAEDPFLGKGSIEVTNVVCDTPSLNTIPGKVTIIADRRISRGETQRQILDELKPILELSDASASIDTERVKTYTGYEIVQEDYFPSWVLEEEHPAVQAAAKAYKAITGKDAKIGKWDFCTNATYLCGVTGIPSIGFGPGDESLCHSSEEVLSIEELVVAAGVYAMIPLLLAREVPHKG